MGAFKNWFEGQAIGSDGQNMTPTQDATAANNVANAFSATPKHAPLLAKLSAGVTHPTTLKAPALKAATLAVNNPRIPSTTRDEVKPPAVAGNLLQNLGVSPVKNPFFKAINPV